MCPLSLSYQKTSRLASNLCLQGFSHFFFPPPALPSIDWWWKAEVGSGVSVDATECQSVVLVPVCRQQLRTGRWGNAGAREVQFYLPPFLPLLLCHQISPPQTTSFFLACLSHALILLLSSWSQGPVLAFPILFFTLFWASWPLKLCSYDRKPMLCVVFICHRVEGECFNV